MQYIRTIYTFAGFDFLEEGLELERIAGERERLRRISSRILAACIESNTVIISKNKGTGKSSF